MNNHEVTDEELTFLKLKVAWNDPIVRALIAEQGIALNILVHDKDPKVRINVLRHNYGVEILRNDPEAWVRKVVKEYDKTLAYRKAKEITDDIFRQAGCL